ncbi:MAG: proline--tRNA ligase [Acidimicrobiia bacterium]|nr:MAG: proline--tRNA ligase [Acidimicrobiia bacterium]
MRMSECFLRTLRDDPADAEVDSHRLLVRAGYIRRVAAGVYSWLPLGYRVLRKVEQIVREEMDTAGAQELLLPITQPIELWQRSGRDVAYGPLMFRLEDRKGSGFCLAPTAEEVVTSLVAQEYTSYRDLPVNLYQIHWKYRDELRPRFGLLRGREFLMKDAYSFDVDVEGLRASYKRMYDAYHRVFERCGLTFRPVEAQAGEIGGDVNHEFMAVAAVGEDDFVWCRSCDYAANVEAARRGHAWHHTEVPAAEQPAPAPVPEPAAGAAPMEKVHTPGLPGIAGVAELLGVRYGEMLKCIAFDVDGDLGLALVPGRPRGERARARPRRSRPGRSGSTATTTFAARPDLPKGYIGPHFPGTKVVVADHSVAAGHGWVTGANESDHHVRHAVLGRDFTVDVWADLVTIVPGDPCPRCGNPLSVDRGIEVGHVFQLGTKYSEALDARFTDEHGAAAPDADGLLRHRDLPRRGGGRRGAPRRARHRVAREPRALRRAPRRGSRAVASRRGAVAGAAERLYAELTGRGLAVLFDDRDVSPGVKFADADLLGMPVQVVVGAKGVARGVVERKVRAGGERDELPIADAVGVLAAAR